MKKKALLSSILTIALCLSLIAGSTFALFTSESKVNVAVTSGTVDVVATVENLKLGTTLAKGNLSETSATQDAEDSNIITLDKIVPGDYVTFDIRIHNNSDVAVQYRTVITKVADEGLWNGLVVTFDDVKYEGTNAVKTEWASMAVGCADIIVSVKVALPEEAGNEYQKTSCKFAYTVEAVQGNAEVTSEWDGHTTTAITKNTEDGKYHINTAAELMWMMEQSQNTALASIYSNDSIVLENNIDLGGATITGFANENVKFGGSFDGEGHTISNFVIDRSEKEDYAGLFNYYSYGTIENLNVKNATVIGQSKVGALLGSIDDGAMVKNCTVENCTVIADRKVGGAVGYAQGAAVNNITVKNTTVYCGTTQQAYEKDQWGKVIGYKNTGYSEDGNVAGDDVVVLTGVSYIANGVLKEGNTYLISNAQGLVYCAQTFDRSDNTLDKVFKLTADIDMTGITWTPWCNEAQYFNGLFDGQNHTISNLTIDDEHTATDGHVVGFIGRLGANGLGEKTIKNVTFDNANVSGHHYVGVAVGYNEYGTADNVKVTNSRVTATHVEGADSCGDKAGAVVGFVGASASNGSVNNCSATNCEVKAARDAGQIVGAAKEAQVSNCAAVSVSVSVVENSICNDGSAGQNIRNEVIGRVL